MLSGISVALDHGHERLSALFKPAWESCCRTRRSQRCLLSGEPTLASLKLALSSQLDSRSFPECIWELPACGSQPSPFQLPMPMEVTPPHSWPFKRVDKKVE